MRSSLAVTLLSLLGAVSAAPAVGMTVAERDSSDLVERNVGGIKLCTDIGWSGTCGYKVQPLNTCIVLTSPYDSTVSSFGPDQGTHCELYSTHDCTTYGCSNPGCGFSPQIFLDYPGSGDLRTQDFNDHLRSFKCWAI